MTVFFKFLNSLRKGHYGLSKTYWKLGVGVKLPLVISTLLSLIFVPALAPVFYGIYMFYVPFYIAGVFNAARNYNNGLIWRYLAYVSVVLGTYIYAQEVSQITEVIGVMKALILK